MYTFQEHLLMNGSSGSPGSIRGNRFHTMNTTGNFDDRKFLILGICMAATSHNHVGLGICTIGFND